MILEMDVLITNLIFEYLILCHYLPMSYFSDLASLSMVVWSFLSFSLIMFFSMEFKVAIFSWALCNSLPNYLHLVFLFTQRLRLHSNGSFLKNYFEIWEVYINMLFIHFFKLLRNFYKRLI